jgi:hypothetical protein
MDGDRHVVVLALRAPADVEGASSRVGDPVKVVSEGLGQPNATSTRTVNPHPHHGMGERRPTGQQHCSATSTDQPPGAILTARYA